MPESLTPQSLTPEREVPAVTTEQVRALVAPLVEAQGLELYDVEDAGAVLRILVDRPGGVDIGAVADATRVISDALDEVDALVGPTTLEVSSPGLERPLRTPEHYARAVGTRVALKTTAGTEGARRFEGTLVEVGEDGVTVEGDDGVRALGYHEIERARTVFEWGGQPRPGGPGTGRSKASAKRSKGAAQTQKGEASA